MNGSTEAALKGRRIVAGRLASVAATLVTIAILALIVRTVDVAALERAAAQAAAEPGRVAMALAAFSGAFVLRAIAWRRVLRGLRFDQALGAIHLALGANHVLPLRLGEPFRIISVTRRAGIALDAATASTVTLRGADVLAVGLIGLLAAPAAFLDLVGSLGLVLLAAVAAVALYGWRWLRVMASRSDDVVLPDGGTFLLSAVAWLSESIVVLQAARWAGLHISWADAVLVTSIAVAAQIAAIAPGGFGTYEAAAVATYATLGYDVEQALVAALAAHALKTAYSLLVGFVALLYPAPSFVGRFRLAPSPRGKPNPDLLGTPGTSTSVEVDGFAAGAHELAPILLFMPAYNEERSVAACLRRVPKEVLGHPVQTLVIDDGSTDATAEEAKDAGADVISLPANRGLGAAVRTGLAKGVALGSAAVVFCDADGEYPPEELANLVAPILNDEADYVTGSRFLGQIDHMRPHRRAGNVALTRLLSVIARRPISDGQTGYRAFSPQAAAGAEVIHDFNYAQVLTLDLLAKGYRFHEVPISYHFRTEGESFIRLGQYLRNVVPAIYRQLNHS